MPILVYPQATSFWLELAAAVVASGFLSYIISLRVAPRAARMQAEAMVEAAQQQAEATVKAGLQQALETEKLRLRHEIARRRLDDFDDAVRTFRGNHLIWKHFTDVLKGSDDRTAIWGAWAEVARRALLVANSRDRDLIRKTVRKVQDYLSEYEDSIAAVARMLHEKDYSGTQIRAQVPEPLKSATECASRKRDRMLTGMDVLAVVVDWAAERRLEAATETVPPSPFELSE